MIGSPSGVASFSFSNMFINSHRSLSEMIYASAFPELTQRIVGTDFVEIHGWHHVRGMDGECSR